MPELTKSQKEVLFKQVKAKGEGLNIMDVVKLIHQFSNLKKEEFQSVLSPELYSLLLEQLHDPYEMSAWNQLQTLPQNTLSDLEALESKIRNYISQFKDAEDSHVNEAYGFLENVKNKIAEIQEQTEWEQLDKLNYNELIKYLVHHPDSRHKDEIDDCMWNCVLLHITIDMLMKYLRDLPSGKHEAEANQALGDFYDWEEVKREGDILKVKAYLDKHTNSPFYQEARNKYMALKYDELENMKESPGDYEIERIRMFFDAGIFTKRELMDEGLITQASWDALTVLDRNILPKILQTEDPNVQSPAGCTDIFFFGTPSTGKTCLLMGLAGANGKSRTTSDGQEYSYQLTMAGRGGKYISDLTIYASTGITPERTYGKFVSVINGEISEVIGKKTISHHINLIEMSGEELAMKIADNPNCEVSFENMGTGVTKLLQNSNRKIFFLIVDPTKDMIPFRFEEEVLDDNGEVIDKIIHKTYISQKIILSKLTSLFNAPENKAIMERVDAIHFIVTKADTLGDMKQERLEGANKVLQTNYNASVGQLKSIVRTSHRLNYSTNGEVLAFTFSLGKFYLGDIFVLDDSDTLELVSSILSVTRGEEEQSTFRRFLDFFN